MSYFILGWYSSSLRSSCVFFLFKQRAKYLYRIFWIVYFHRALCSDILLLFIVDFALFVSFIGDGLCSTPALFSLSPSPSFRLFGLLLFANLLFCTIYNFSQSLCVQFNCNFTCAIYWKSMIISDSRAYIARDLCARSYIYSVRLLLLLRLCSCIYQ